MERAQFEQIVTEMEALNRRDPDAYRQKVARFASLGFVVYGVTFVVVLALLALSIWLVVKSANTGTIKLVLVVGFLALVFLRALWIKVEPPKGRPITAAEAPELVRELERIRTQIGAPPIHEIQVDPSFNAYATSAPKFAIFGERCYVVLGLPLMLTEPRDEVVATIGHELAHHSKSHVKSGTRAYRLEIMWRNVLTQLLEAGSIAAKPLLAFVAWYSPRFSAMSLVLRRQAEFEADAVGAEATSKQAMAIGLVRMGVDGPTVLKPYYQRLERTAVASETPPNNFLSALQDLPPAPAEEREKALVRTLKSETVYEDSHPAIRLRVEALGIPADPNNGRDVAALMEMLGTVERSAAEEFFGPRLPALLKEFDDKWSAAMKEAWKESHREYQESTKTLADFATADPATLPETDLVKWLDAFGHLNGPATVLPYAQAAAQRFPSNGRFQFIAGYCLVEADDERGVDYLQRAADLDRSYRASALEAIAEFHSARGDSYAARSKAIEASEQHDANMEAFERILRILKMDTLLPSGASQAELERIVALLPKVERLQEAYALRKHDTQLPEVYLDVIVLVVKRPAFVSDDDTFCANELKKAFEIVGNTQGIYLLVTVPKSETAKALAARPDLRVFPTASP